MEEQFSFKELSVAIWTIFVCDTFRLEFRRRSIEVLLFRRFLFKCLAELIIVWTGSLEVQLAVEAVHEESVGELYF